MLIACVDGLAGFPDAIAADLRPVYVAVNKDAAAEQLVAFDAKRGQRYR